MNTAPVPRILVVDDNLAIHEDFAKILGGHSPVASRLGGLEEALFCDEVTPVKVGPFRVDFASQGQEAFDLVEAARQADDPYALAFVDVRMPPGWDGFETIERLWQVCPELQVVLCTAYSDYSCHDILRHFGQTDNLLVLKKPFETVEVVQLAQALARKWLLGRQARLRLEDLEHLAEQRAEQLCREAQERARAQRALLVSEERFGKAFDSSPMPMAIVSWPERRFLATNASFCELTGHPAESVLKHRDKDLNLWIDPASLEASLQPEGRLRQFSCVLRRADGQTRSLVVWTEPMTSDPQPCLLLLAQDVTEHLRLEASLLQAQKLEVVGRLVAGVAHEVNNVLTIVQGNAGLLESKLAGREALQEHARSILRAGERAARFTRQLLGMSRPAAVRFEALDLSACAQRVSRLLEQGLGSKHELKLVLAEDLPLVRADEGNVEQVLMNLAINARDAMPQGGAIVVGACAANLTETDAQRTTGAKPGRFVCLAVSDRGCGIPPEIVGRIFDPFFTTKEVGKGTGLGLWMVQSIVRRHGGWIELATEVGKGASFKVFLPVWDEPAAARKTAEQPDLSAESVAIPAAATAQAF